MFLHSKILLRPEIRVVLHDPGAGIIHAREGRTSAFPLGARLPRDARVSAAVRDAI